MADKAEMIERLKEIDRRRMDAYRDGSGKGLTTTEHLALIPEATTHDDITVLAEARRMLDPYAEAVLGLYVDVWREFGKYRCSVCGMTTKQAEAAGYDCSHEC